MTTNFTLVGTTVPPARTPIANIVISPEFAVLGSVVTVDARLSRDPDELPLTYDFSFVSVPIGSKVALEGFRQLDEHGNFVSFSPDVVGQYIIGLVVSNGTFQSEPVQAFIDVRVILVPHARGLVPDGKFLWSYIRDVWTQVDGREFFETLWSALLQISGAELLKLYQIDFNKSIRDIQEFYQRRWLCYEPKLTIADGDSSFFLGTHCAGVGAATGSSGEAGLAVITSRNELLVVQGTVRPDLAGKTFKLLYSRNDENVGDYVIAGMTAKQNGFRLTTAIPKNPTNTKPPAVSDMIVEDAGYTFPFGSTTWSSSQTKGGKFEMYAWEQAQMPWFKGLAGTPGMEDIRIGDVAVIPYGVNAGVYRIINKSGANIMVDKKPPAASDADTAPITIYRPVGFTIPAVEDGLTDIVTIPLSEAPALEKVAPGRVIVVNGQASTIARVAVDSNQRVPIVVLAMDRKSLMPGLKARSWRLPHTLVSKSQDFEALGVAAGDALIGTVVLVDGSAVDVPLQVVGVDRNRLGFVLTNEPLVDGMMPEVPNSTFLALADRFGITSVNSLPDGSIAFGGRALDMMASLKSIYFQRQYWNVELSPTTEFRAGELTFNLVPKAVIRNKLIPVDPEVRSIPALQEFIKQPDTTVADGKLFQVRDGKRFPLVRVPSVLLERMHFLVDSEVIGRVELTFRTGSTVVDADGGDFIDQGLMPGDIFSVVSPLSIAGDYRISRVLSRNRLELAIPIPQYPLGAYVTGTVDLLRGRSGRFIRMIPGLYTAKYPAPDRLWAEVTFFDNGENIERNFGVLVGLTRADLEHTTSTASYRQAVAGLMYAFVNGPAVDKIKLGASLLLGLPFTEKRGIIRSIETDYRRNYRGEAVLGRILVEDVDAKNTPLGLHRLYTFPIDEVSQLAGIDTNPNTGKPYVVGDIVEAFKSLSKGVEIADFKTPTFGAVTVEKALQRYHSARIRVNDNIFSPKEIKLVSEFLRKITPSYIALTVTNTSEFRDTVEVLDKIRMRLGSGPWNGPILCENIGFGLQTAFALDLKTHKGFFPTHLNQAYNFRRAGRNLLTSLGSITVPTGGLVTPTEHDGREAPVCEAGDYLVILGGANDGVFPIAGITDTSIELGPVNGEVPYLADKVDQHWAVIRPIRDLLHSGAIGNIVGPLVQVETGLRRNGVMPGDWFLAEGSDGFYTRHTIYAVGRLAATDPYEDKVWVTPSVAAGAMSFAIYRPSLFPDKSTEEFGILSTGVAASLATQEILHALAEPLDELEIDAQEVGGVWERTPEFRVTIIDPQTLYLSPPLPAGMWKARLIRPNRGFYNILARNIGESVSVSLGHINTDTADAVISADTVSWSGWSPATAGIKPGDLFKIDGNPASYPIAEVSDTTVKLTVSPPSGTVKWHITRRA